MRQLTVGSTRSRRVKEPAKKGCRTSGAPSPSTSPSAGEPIPELVFEELGLDRAAVEAQFDELVESKDSIMAIAGMMS